MESEDGVLLKRHLTAVKKVQEENEEILESETVVGSEPEADKTADSKSPEKEERPIRVRKIPARLKDFVL